MPEPEQPAMARTVGRGDSFMGLLVMPGAAYEGIPQGLKPLEPILGE